MQLKAETQIDYISKAADFRQSVFDKILDKNNDRIWLKASLADVKKVVVILSSPRSGSSLLFVILKKIPQIYSPSGESVPFYKLNGLSSDSFSSDRIPDELIKVVGNNSNISRDFLSDFSFVRDQDEIMHNQELLDQYIDELILRFCLQWPQIDFSYDIFKQLVTRALDDYLKTHRKFSKEGFYLELLGSLRSKYAVINPYYYDLPQELIKNRFPDVEVPSGPPNGSVMIEEPPFILLSPGRKINKENLSKDTLLLKTSVDSYKMDYLESILPFAEIKVVYLIRNPLASINSLYDGWLYGRGFFSYNLKEFFRNNKIDFESLKISGYSDKYAWAKWWWNFDLPPGWQDFVEKSLEEVCAFQWYSSHKAIQQYLDKAKVKFCHVKYEDIIRSLESRINEIEKILDFMEVDHNAIKDLGLDNLPVVQTTSSPKPYRWKEKQNILLSVINNPKISEMCTKLEYSKERVEEWL